MQPFVLFEDNHLLVVNKPAGLATAGVTDAPSVYGWAGEYIKQKYNKPGNVFVGIVSRLDTMTSGVLVLARTSKAAARLSEQIRLHEFEKKYLAVVEGHLVSTAGEIWTDQMFKDDAAHRMRALTTPHGNRSGKHLPPPGKLQEARLQIGSVQHLIVGSVQASLISIELLTGRKHQIRVQCSQRGHAVWGDRKYGAKTPELRDAASENDEPQIDTQTYDRTSTARGRGIALHAHQLAITHPTQKQRLTFVAPPPKSWNRFGRLEY